MYLGLCLIGVIAAVWAITALPTRPHTETVRPRDLERRDAQLRACPDRVTKLDVERALAARFERTRDNRWRCTALEFA
ncbi:hypothetical protein ACFP8W_01910 [Nocardioides hankookensis]